MMNFIHKLILTSMVLSISLLLWPTDTVHAGNTKTAVTGQTLNLTYRSSGVTGNCNLTVPGGGGYTGTTIAGNSSGNYNPGNASVGGSFTLNCTPSGGGNINDTATLSILSCSPGDYINGSVCSPCVAGNYCPGGTASPVQCEFDFYCPAGASGHTACPAFYTSSPGSTKYGDCIPPSCAPGTYWNGSSCTTCTAGNYCPGDGSYYSCSYGYTSSPGATGSGQCVPRCSVGNYWNGSSCSTCPQGKTCDGTGTQTPCPAGKICPAGTGPGGGTDCTAGNFCPQGTTPGGGTQPPRACTELGAGYTSNAGAGSSAQCFLPTCQPGEYLNASSCVQCTAGYFCDGSGSRTPCVAGTYCPAGTTSSGVNGPKTCPQNSFCPAQSGSPTPCDPTVGAGYITDSSGATNGGQCHAPSCPSGQYWGGSSCTQCTAGYYCDGTSGGRTPCPEKFYCGPGTTEPSNPSNPPRACTAGYMCDAGTTDSGAGSPTPCTQDHFCTGGNSGPSGSNPPTACSTIGTDLVTTGTGATSSADCHLPYCPSGNYWDTGTHACTTCPEGKICDGTTAPQPCTVGYFCPAGTEPSGTNRPKDCPVGSWCDGANGGNTSNNGGYPPQPCLGGLTSPINSVSSGACRPPTCPSGEYWNSTAGSCKPCTSGNYCGGDGTQTPCPSGFVCRPTTTQPGGTTPPKRCPAGSSCPGGNTDPADPGTNTNPPIICTANHYCPTGTGPTDPGTINPLPCPEGKWSTVGSSQLSDCQSSNPSGPDLTIDTIYPTTVTSGVMTTFYTTIENRGTTNTGASFYNLVYFADDINGGGNISTTTPYNGLYPAYYTGKMGILGVSEATTTSARHAFTAPGSVKFCTDKQNQNDATGLVNEGTGENNNCTGWINIAISGVSACVPGPGMYHNGTTCVACPPGNFCPGGTTPNPCPPNTYCDGAGPGGIGNTPPGGTYPPISCNGGFVSPQGSGSSGSCVSGGSPSGTLTSSSNSCTIATGQSTCDVTMSWSTNSPVGTTELIRDGQAPPGVPDAVGNNVSDQLIHVPYESDGTVVYQIYNNNTSLASKSINVSCEAGANKYDTVSGTCANPQVNSLLVRGNYYDDPGHIEFKCGGSDSYEVRMDPTGANTLVPGGSGVSTGDNQLHSVSVSTTQDYKIICKKGSVEGTMTTSYTNPADRPQVALSFTAVPKTIEVGGKVVLNWDITYPAPACVMTAQVVCPNGTCNQTLTSYQTELNAMIQSGRVDQVAGSQTTPRTIASSISTVTPGHETTDQKAIGKKTLSSVQGTTDFMIDCGGTKKASTRVRVTSSKEN